MKLLLIDGSNLIFRAYYATEKQNITMLDNRPANAINTLISMINKLVEEHKPTHMFIALDTGKSTFRHEHYPEYKGKRSETPEKLRAQFPIAKELYDAMGIRHYATESFEADDLIATYAKTAARLGYDVQIVSGDKDLLQLVEDNITVTTPAMGFAKEVRYTPEVFFEKFSFTPNRFTEYKALVGDKSDNIIGIAKVGDKTAQKLINQYTDLESIVHAAKNSEIKGVVGANLAEGLEQLESNMHLVTLIDNIDLDCKLDELEFSDFNYETFLGFLKNAGFTKFLNQFSKKTSIDQSKLSTKKFEHNVIYEFDITQHTGLETYIYTQSLADNYYASEGLGIGLYSEKGLFYLSMEKINDQFIEFLRSEQKKICYDLKRLMVLTKQSIVNGVEFDIFLGLSLINNDNYKRTLDVIAVNYGVDFLNTQEQVYGSKTKPQLPVKSVLIEDICHKAYALKIMHIKILNELEDLELTDIYANVELPLAPVLAKMEMYGVFLDEKRLGEIEEQYNTIIGDLTEKINQIIDFNFDSPKQLSDYLFITKELPSKGIKKNASSFSTDVTNLNKLKDLLIIDSEKYTQELSLIEYILTYRKYKKIVSTYLEGLRNHIIDGKIHPLYQQLLVETGRLSAIAPNVQNIPIRTNEGQVIRELFIAPEGHRLAAIDYSQVELRVIAHMAQEKHMIEDFKNNLDIHSETAKKILNQTTVDSKQRSQAKAINFGIIYGMSQYGLAKQLDISNEQAKEFIERYFINYPQIEQYMKQASEFARTNGYSKTLFNRRRYISGLNSKSKMEIEAANRIAINTPIQGTAADIMKLAMIEIDRFLTEHDYQTKMVMQIHDELVFYIPNEEIHILDALREKMENIVHLDVFLKAEANLGDNWLQAK